MLSRKDEQTAPESSVAGALQRFALENGLYLHAAAERLGMAVTDFFCLSILLMEGSASAGRLAERTGLTTGAITGVVDRLARRGWVRRDVDPDDRRRVVVRVADTRPAALGAVLGPMLATHQDLAARLAPADRTMVRVFVDGAAEAVAGETDRLRRGLADPASPPGGDHPPVDRAELRLAAWSGNVVLRPAPLARDLVRVGPHSRLEVRVRGARVALAPGGRGRSRGTADAEVVEVHEDVMWTVELSGGANRMRLDLAGVRLAGIRIGGGANRLELVLPAPVGVVAVQIRGGANHVQIGRPAGSDVALRIGGGANDVRVDGVRYGDAAPQADRQSPDRYEIDVGGGASKIVIE